MLITPPKMNMSTLKRVDFKREGSSPNHLSFWGEYISFKFNGLQTKQTNQTDRRPEPNWPYVQELHDLQKKNKHWQGSNGGWLQTPKMDTLGYTGFADGSVRASLPLKSYHLKRKERQQLPIILFSLWGELLNFWVWESPSDTIVRNQECWHRQMLVNVCM